MGYKGEFQGLIKLARNRRKKKNDKQLLIIKQKHNPNYLIHDATTAKVVQSATNTAFNTLVKNIIDRAEHEV